ncbi:MAG: ribosome recycling factor, partial [Neisseria elongata]
MIDDVMLEAEDKMDKALQAAKSELATIRTGRANPSMFNGIVVDYYGAPTPLQQLASLTIPEARTVLVSPFDRSAMKDIVTAIRESDTPFRYTAALADSIETAWQDHWEAEGTFNADNPVGGLAGPGADKETFFLRDMFPYPSGKGLHLAAGINLNRRPNRIACFTPGCLFALYRAAG